MKCIFQQVRDESTSDRTVGSDVGTSPNAVDLMPEQKPESKPEQNLQPVVEKPSMETKTIQSTHGAAS